MISKHNFLHVFDILVIKFLAEGIFLLGQQVQEGQGAGPKVGRGMGWCLLLEYFLQLFLCVAQLLRCQGRVDVEVEGQLDTVHGQVAFYLFQVFQFLLPDHEILLQAILNFLGIEQLPAATLQPFFQFVQLLSNPGILALDPPSLLLFHGEFGHLGSGLLLAAFEPDLQLLHILFLPLDGLLDILVAND